MNMDCSQAWVAPEWRLLSSRKARDHWEARRRITPVLMPPLSSARTRRRASRSRPESLAAVRRTSSRGTSGEVKKASQSTKTTQWGSAGAAERRAWMREVRRWNLRKWGAEDESLSSSPAGSETVSWL
jgi:hypothetical protein